MTGSQDKDHYSVDEVAQKLEVLTEGQLLKLTQLGRLWATRLRGYDPMDLVQEACVRLLTERKWPRELPIEAMFHGAMRSIVAQWSPNANQEAQALVFEAECAQDEDGDSPLQRANAKMPKPDEMLEAEDEFKAELEAIEGHFQDDETVLEFILWKAEGYSPAEIQQELSLSPTQYDSILKRIRRYVLKARKA